MAVAGESSCINQAASWRQPAQLASGVMASWQSVANISISVAGMWRQMAIISLQLMYQPIMAIWPTINGSVAAISVTVSALANQPAWQHQRPSARPQWPVAIGNVAKMWRAILCVKRSNHQWLWPSLISLTNELAGICVWPHGSEAKVVLSMQPILLSNVS